MKTLKVLLKSELVLNIGFGLTVLLIGKVTLYFIG